MSLKVSDQALVFQQVEEAAARARERLRTMANSSKSFRNSIFKLNSLARDVTDDLEVKYRKKLDHLSNKQGSINTTNGEITIGTSTRHKYE